MKRKTKLTILAGILSVLLLAAASWHSAVYNDSRILAPMDYSQYRFQMQDLPMILSIAVFLLWICWLVFLLFRGILAEKKRERTAVSTRTISPKFGFLGFFGFAGFAGFYTYGVDQTIFPFLAFVFFGFFGFFYEGKMSDTFMDERYRENRMHARLAADRIALSIIFIAMIFCVQGRLLGDPMRSLTLLLIITALAFALNIFLGEYLLYRYDHDDPSAFGDDESGV